MDRIIDMVRTVLNLTGDASVSTIIALSENETDCSRTRGALMRRIFIVFALLLAGKASYCTNGPVGQQRLREMTIAALQNKFKRPSVP